MKIRVKVDGKFETVEVIKKVSVGLRPTHNADGQFQKVWALATDGRIYRTSSYGGCYKPMQPGETPPDEIRTGHVHRCLACDAIIASGVFDCEFDRDHDWGLCARCVAAGVEV